MCLTVLGLAFLIYLLLPTKMYYWDGVGFALTIERASNDLASLYHPNAARGRNQMAGIGDGRARSALSFQRSASEQRQLACV